VSVPAISVVIPTYNRREQLRGALVGLAGQTGLTEPPEVVVVSDGSSDGTDEFLQSPECPLPVVAVRQDNAGPAAARNRGIREATGDLVLFIDDDVVPAPDLLAAHLRHHVASGDDDTVVIGPMITPTDEVLSPWVRWEQDMLYKQYAAMERGEWEATARQFYTANASIARRHLVAAGGFDEAFRRAEDVELAYRLADRGLRFTFAKDAVVDHHAERSFVSWLDIAGQYGRNDVIFGRDLGQRWLLDSIATEFHGRHRLVRTLTRTCAPRPGLRRLMIGVLKGTTRAASALHLRPVAKLSLSALYNLAYYGGMADELGSGDRMLMMFEDRHAGRALRPRVGFVLEQTLGHITHANNLQHLIGNDESIEAVFEPIAYDVEGWAARVPGFGNWTVRAGIRTRRAIRRLHKGGPIDALFIHTQVPAIMSPDHVKHLPTVVSLDATPIQYDELGAQYGHDTGGRAAERLKWQANKSCFARAETVVAWAEWTKRGLVDRYEVPADKVVVIPPGVDYARWSAYRRNDDAGPPRDTAALRVLFVGGDLERKGGFVLLEAVRRLRDAGVAIELDLVTRDEVPPQEGVRAHHGLTPNSPPLIDLYHGADVFCLPTMGDCLPMVLSEAGAVGLPLVSTDVGAISEIVRDGETGLLVPVDDAGALAAALHRLADDPDGRRRMGEAARALVRERFDAGANARTLVALLLDIAVARRLARRR
jgi:glycosyltransferase involved in cell wall biosynthesis/GT2 family glycosyltransferase